MDTRHFIGTLIFLLLSHTAHADLPLSIEDLLTDKGKLKLELSVAYGNHDRQGLAVGEPLLLQTGPTSFISLPTRIGETKTNSDALVATAGLRYGLTARTEIFSRASALYRHTRSSSALSEPSRQQESRFADAWLGLNHQFKKDDATPAVLGFVELALREKHQNSSSSLKSFLLGLSAYKAIDPVVFSLTAATRLNQSRKDGNSSYKPGNLLLLNPSIAFAVNDQVTFTGGVQWTAQQADRQDGQAQGFRRTSTSLLLGVGYGISKDSTINLSFKANASGSGGADLRLSWLHTL